MATNKYKKRVPKYDMGGVPGLGQLQQVQAQIGNTMGDALINKGGRTNAAANIGGNVFKGAMSGTGIIGAGMGLVTGIMDYNKAKQEKENYDRSVQINKNLQEADNFQQTLKNNQANIPTFPNGGSTKPTSEGYNKFQQDIPKEQHLKDMSRLYYYKQQLDSTLQQQNPNLYGELQSKTQGKPFQRQLAIADSIAGKNPNFALPITKQQEILGKNYPDFNNLRDQRVKQYNSFGNRAAVAGSNETTPASDTAYGARNSTFYTPGAYSRIPKNSKGIVTEQYDALATYNPLDQSYKYDYTYTPLKAEGGDLEQQQSQASNQPYIINYKGASHANGGIVVNSTSGNPTSITGEEEGAEVEGKHMSNIPQKGEIGVRFKDTKSPYIFSDKLGFAKQAEKIQKRYSLRPNDKISQDAMYSELQGLMGEQEEVRNKMIDKHVAKIKELGGDLDEYSSGGSIHIKKSHEGRFTAYKERTGKTTEEALHSKDPHVRQMANFAKNAAKWHHEDGGDLDLPQFDGTNPNGQYLNAEDEVQANADRMAQGMKFDPNNTLLVNPNQSYSATPESVNNESLYTGQTSPLGAITNMASNAILMATNKKAPGITSPYINPQSIDLSQAREAIRNNAIYSRANRLASLRGAGLSQAQYAGATSVGDTDINRGIGEGLTQSYLTEQGANAGYRQQADMANASTNMQTQQYNAAIQDRYNKEQQEYLANLLNTPSQYLNEQQKAQRDAMLIQTQSPDVNVYQRKGKNIFSTPTPYLKFK